MKKVEKVLLAALLFVAIATMAEQVQATKQRGLPFDCSVEPVSYSKSTGKLTLQLTVTQRFYTPMYTACSAVTVSVSGVDDLELSGPESWQAHVDSLTPYSTRLEVKVPDNDTSGLIVELECNKYRMGYSRYFITTGDTIKAVWSDPRYHIGIGEPPTEEEFKQWLQKDYERAKREWEEEQERLPRAKPVDLSDSSWPNPPATSEEIKAARRQQKLEEMRKLEETPLTDSDCQTIYVDGVVYIRWYGESKFRVAEPITDEDAFVKRFLDSLNSLPPETEYDVSLDLRDSADFVFVKGLVDSLVPKEAPGFYRCRITKADVEKLYKQGISVKFLDLHPRERDGLIEEPLPPAPPLMRKTAVKAQRRKSG